jgi:hypothetical protein
MADEYTLGDVVRLLDGLAESTHASFDRIETEMRIGFERLDKRVDALRTEVRTGFERVDRRLDRIEARVEDVEKRVAVVEGRP